jgi:hypothetical protein
LISHKTSIKFNTKNTQIQLELTKFQTIHKKIINSLQNSPQIQNSSPCLYFLIQIRRLPYTHLTLLAICARSNWRYGRREADNCRQMCWRAFCSQLPMDVVARFCLQTERKKVLLDFVLDFCLFFRLDFFGLF